MAASIAGKRRAASRAIFQNQAPSASAASHRQRPAIDFRPYFRYGESNLAHVKDAIRVTAAGGASAVPAGGGSSLLLPGGFGHQPAGTMTGARGARCNRDRRQAGVPCQSFGACPAKPGPKLSLGMHESLGREPRWNAGRRAYPLTRMRAAARKAAVVTEQRLTAFRFLFLSLVARMKRSEIRGRS